MLRVAIDVTPLAGPRTGIGNFVANLAEGVHQHPDAELVGLAMTARGRDEIMRALPADVPLTRPMPARLLRSMWARLDYPTIGQLNGHGADPIHVVHGTNYVSAPGGEDAIEVVTVHDLSVWYHPEKVNESSRIYPTLLDRALARGAHVHAISHFVANELVEDLGIDKDRVHVVHLAADPLPVGDAARGRRVAGSDTFLLAIGSVEPRKDYPTLVAAFNALASQHPDLRLVIAGGPGFGSDELDAVVARSPVKQRIVFPGYIDVATKADLLAAASVVVSTATYEGFGIVPIEAMACGTPVVAVAGGSIPEVSGDAAVLVPAAQPKTDTDQLAAALDRLLTDSGLRQDLITRGHLQAARFTWESATTGLVDLYARLAKV